MRAKLLLVSALSILALGGIMATGAHAVKSEWMIKDQTLAKLKVKEETVAVSGGPLSLIIPSKSVTLECLKAEGSGKIFEGGADEATVTLAECKVVGAACEVSGAVKLEVKSHLISAGDYYRKVESLTEGKPISTISFKGEKCTLPAKNEVKGNVAASFSSEELTSQTLTFSEAISSTVNKALKEAGEAELKLSFGEFAAILSGKLSLKLTGANSGKEFHLAGATKLCKEPPVNGACAAGKVWPTETLLRMEHAAPVVTKFKIGIAEFQCQYSVLGGPTTVEEGEPLTGRIETAAFTECGAGCEVAVLEMPYDTRIEARGTTGHGLFTMLGPEFEFECPGPEICKYSATRLALPLLIGGTPAFLNSAPLSMTKQAGSAAGCDMPGRWEGTTAPLGTIKYEFTEPGALYVTP